MTSSITNYRRIPDRLRTDGSRLNHVADSEPLDGLVLRSTSGAVGAANWLNMAPSVLVTTAMRGTRTLALMS